MIKSIHIRPAGLSDAEAILEIYAHYVKNTAITFEYDVPSPEEFAGRIENTLRRYPYIVAERDGQIVGYAYAGVFKDRAAYDHCVEVTVYLHPEVCGAGIGAALYEALEGCLAEMGILNLYACIAVTGTEDEYLTNRSARFHERVGYRTAGRFTKCGYKFGRWYDMVWMEKFIGEHL